MAGKAAKATGVDTFFDAVEGLTWREMREVCQLITMILIEAEVKTVGTDELASALADASEAHRAGED